MLNSILKIDTVEVLAIFTIPEWFKISYSDQPVRNTNYYDFSDVAKKIGVPVFEINSEKGKRLTDFKDQIKQFSPDVILVMGWYYMVPQTIRVLARYGAWGIHASMLPEYAGGAPLVWAIIEGKKESGVTLFKLDDGVDDGDIIAQKSFEIADHDTIKEVYDKATEASVEILNTALKSESGIQFRPQDKSLIKVYPQRSSKDGEIDWSWDSKRIRDFIRAQTKPYPGAWFNIGNKKVVIWSADILERD
jgi:methionyl-tRNA formyltransferase